MLFMADVTICSAGEKKKQNRRDPGGGGEGRGGQRAGVKWSDQGLVRVVVPDNDGEQEQTCEEILDFSRTDV